MPVLSIKADGFFVCKVGFAAALFTGATTVNLKEQQGTPGDRDATTQRLASGGKVGFKLATDSIRFYLGTEQLRYVREGWKKNRTAKT